MGSAPAPLRLVHLITGLQVGGAEMHLYKTVTRFHPRRLASIVVSVASPGKIGNLLKEHGIPVLTLGMKKGLPNPLALVRLVNLLKGLRPHLLQTYLYHADLLGYLAGRWAGVPAILWNLRNSNMDFSKLGPTTGLAARLCARLSRGVNRILVNSFAGLKAHALMGYDAGRMVVFPNGFDLARFRPEAASRREVRHELGLPGEARLVGMLARFDPQKDHRTFLQAARLLADRPPEVHFLLAGRGVSGANPAFAELAAAARIPPERLHLLGERADVPRLLAALDCYVCSSAFGEGFANAVGEAMACGVPCVVTDVGDAALIVRDTGLVVPPRDPQELAEAVGQVLAWPAALWSQRSQAARARLAEKFDINRVAARLESFYLALGAAAALSDGVPASPGRAPTSMANSPWA